MQLMEISQTKTCKTTLGVNQKNSVGGLHLEDCNHLDLKK